MSEDLNNSLFGDFFYKPAVKWSAKYRIFHTGHAEGDALSNRFTGVIEFSDGLKQWIKEGKLHREDGPAAEYFGGYKEYFGGYKEWFLEGKQYSEINLNDYIILDEYEGKYNLMWYKLLGKDEMLEYPDIPGLIEKE